MRINILRRIKRAVLGFFLIITSDTSVRLMSAIGIAVLALAFWIGVSRIEMVVILVIVFSVIILEGINTVLERVIDLVEPRYQVMVREIKDALAGLVLLASVGAAIVGVIIFWPYIVERLG